MVGRRAGAAGLQVGPSLAGRAVLIAGDLALEEEAEGSAVSTQLPPRLLVTQPRSAAPGGEGGGAGRDQEGQQGSWHLVGSPSAHWAWSGPGSRFLHLRRLQVWGRGRGPVRG